MSKKKVASAKSKTKSKAKIKKQTAGQIGEEIELIKEFVEKVEETKNSKTTRTP